MVDFCFFLHRKVQLNVRGREFGEIERLVMPDEDDVAEVLLTVPLVIGFHCSIRDQCMRAGTASILIRYVGAWQRSKLAALLGPVPTAPHCCRAVIGRVTISTQTMCMWHITDLYLSLAWLCHSRLLRARLPGPSGPCVSELQLQCAGSADRHTLTSK